MLRIGLSCLPINRSLLAGWGLCVAAALVADLVGLGYSDRRLAATGRCAAGTGRAGGIASALRTARGPGYPNLLADMRGQLGRISAGRKLQLVSGAGLVSESEIARGSAKAAFHTAAGCRCRRILPGLGS